MSQNKDFQGKQSNPGGDADPYLPDVQTQINDLNTKIDLLRSAHIHNGTDATRTNMTDILLNMKRPLDKNIGIFRVTATIPSAIPIDPFDQLQLYVNGATLRLYIYDWSAAVWHYVTLTA